MKKSRIIILSALTLFCCISFICIYQGNNGDFEYVEVENSTNSVTNADKDALFFDYLKGQIREHLLSVKSIDECDVFFDTSENIILSTNIVVNCNSEPDDETKLAVINYISSLLNLPTSSITIEYK